MNKLKTFQDWVTVHAAGATDILTQDIDNVLDAGGETGIRVSGELKAISNAAFSVETAVSLDGPWFQRGSWTLAGPKALDLWCESNRAVGERLQRFVRWKVTASGGGASACFWLGFESLSANR